MADPDPKNIAKEISQRDEFYMNKTDFIGVMISPYDDGLNYVSFVITSAGTIADMKTVGDFDDNDGDYDVVFDAKISFDKFGWNAEFKIPYSALRFPKKDIQSWGLNFFQKSF